MRVKVVYRNYIPLYSGYSSFWEDEIEGVEFVIPKVNNWLNPLFKIYRKLKHLKLVDFLVKETNSLFFSSENDSKYNMLFFAGILPDKIPNAPFVIDFEHANAFYDFGAVTKDRKCRILDVLESEKCRAILPWSKAAEKSLRLALEKDFKRVEKKVELVYPALSSYKNKYKPDNSIINASNKIKILFVGKNYLRKGLLESLTVFGELNKKYGEKFEFHVVSNFEPEEELSKTDNFFFYEANFNHEDLVKMFFLTCDLFVMPTREDTFGMVLLEALSCGLPVITSDQFATREIINKENGFLVKSNSLEFFEVGKTNNKFGEKDELIVKNLKKVMIKIFESPELLKSMSENTTKEFLPGGKFCLETRSKKIEEILNK